jgi:methylthioribulose-1-phosphate dehydratase
MDKGRLTADHFLEVEQNGNAVNGGGGKPSAETLLHIAVVRATGAASVLHTHSVWSTVLSDLYADKGGFFIEGYEMLKGLEGVTTHEHREWIPILENTQDMKALAAEASALLQKGLECTAYSSGNTGSIPGEKIRTPRRATSRSWNFFSNPSAGGE